MHRHPLLWIALTVVVGACAQFDGRYPGGFAMPGSRGDDSTTLTAALREALEQGTARAVGVLGRNNGYFANPQVRIPIPENLRRIEQTLRRLGLNKYADDFVLSMNRAAERAAPEAAAVFLSAIRNMSVQDAAGIVRGPDNAATEYFRRHTERDLFQKFRPIVSRSTERVGVTRQYKQLVQRLGPAVPTDVRKFDLDSYVTQEALDGLFLMVAQEEKRIRTDPAARTTQLLRQVFGK